MATSAASDTWTLCRSSAIAARSACAATAALLRPPKTSGSQLASMLADKPPLASDSDCLVPDTDAEPVIDGARLACARLRCARACRRRATATRTSVLALSAWSTRPVSCESPRRSHQRARSCALAIVVPWMDRLHASGAAAAGGRETAPAVAHAPESTAASTTTGNPARRRVPSAGRAFRLASWRRATQYRLSSMRFMLVCSRVHRPFVAAGGSHEH